MKKDLLLNLSGGSRIRSRGSTLPVSERLFRGPTGPDIQSRNLLEVYLQ